MPRSHSTTSLLSQAFKQGKSIVPPELDIEIAYDRKAGEWNCFATSVDGPFLCIGRGSNPMTALESFCELNDFKE